MEGMRERAQNAFADCVNRVLKHRKQRRNPEPEHHPSVGYLLACSTDDPMYRRQCDDVRFQRRCTLMEGGDYCEFCFYRL